MDQEQLAQLLLATFLEEMQEHVAHINHQLIALEKNPLQEQRAEIFTLLFRSAHTLKGSSRAVNAEPIEAACHQLEEVLTAIREERIEPTSELFALLFATADAIEETGMWLREEQDLTVAPLNRLTPRLQQAAEGKLTEASPQQEAAGQAIHSDQSAPFSSATAGPLHEPPRTSPDPTSSPPADRRNRQFSPQTSQRPAVSATVRIDADKLDSLLAKSGELLIARRRVASRTVEVAELCDLVGNWKKEWTVVDQLLRQLNLLDDVDHRDKSQFKMSRRAAAALAGNHQRLQQLKGRLDRLVSRIQADSRHLDTTCDALEDEVHQVRMLPFDEACRGLERAARDVARKCGKEVELKVVAKDVEIDRSVLEGLKDPLLHLVRNAVDHGIEASELRQRNRKSTTGVITISAALRGAEVEVAVADDGGGVDLERIREKVRQAGLPEPSDEAGLLNMLFHPSFSTAEIVTDISGRGVGLDVVRSTVESLHGTVQVSFEPGKGTRFTIRVPLTLTTIRAVLVIAAGQTYGVATNSVRQLVRFSSKQLRSMAGHRVLLLAGAPLPIVSLTDALGMPGNSPTVDDKKLAIVLDFGGQSAALVVDDALAEQEVTVKSLGFRIRRVRHVSGAALLPSGRIALVLNVANLIRTALATPTSPDLATRRDTVGTTSTHRVLVVDDSLTTRALVKSILETAGYAVEIAVDGDDAWRRIQENKPELVVTDVDMPNMDGFTLTSRIRNSAHFSALPVILVTAQEDDQDRTRGVQAGANAYVLKSAFDQHNLLETIAQLL